MAERKDEAIKLLRSIDLSLKQLIQQQPKPDATVADDRDLDSKYGNPELRFNPRDWHGASYKGRRFSECPAELLDLVASSLDYFAKKSEDEGKTTASGKPVAPYERLNAARARGWAKRKRAGWRESVDTETGEILDDPPVSANPFESSEWPDEDVAF